MSNSFNHLNQFCSNMNKNNNITANRHNLYVLQTKDTDGNITSEAYGMNLMTDVGLKAIYSNAINQSVEYIMSYYSYNFTIFIGRGTTAPVTSNASLYDPIIASGAIFDCTFKNVWYPMEYDSNTDFITSKAKWCQHYFDYNIDSITSSIDISEIGIGSSTTNLYFHTLIYDINGNPTTITKNINERLYITTYISANIKASIIKNTYDRKLYALINPLVLFPEYGIGQYVTSINKYMNCYCISPRSVSCINNSTKLWNTPVTVSDNSINNTVAMGSALLESSDAYWSHMTAYIGRDRTWNSDKLNGLGIIFKRLELPEPEEITSYDCMSSSYLNNDITNIFGDSAYNINNMTGTIPVTDFTVTSLSMYNHAMKDWTIQETFSTNSDKIDLSNSMLWCIEIMTNNGGTPHVACVYCNDNIANKIVKFKESTFIIYATDEYWDVSTWELITNNNAIQESLQTKKYYILDNPGGAFAQLSPVREVSQLTYEVEQDAYAITPFYQQNYINTSSTKQKTLRSESFNWICFDSDIIYPNATPQKIYPIYRTGTTRFDESMYRWATDDTIIIADVSNFNKLYTYKISSDSNVTPVLTMVSLDFTTPLSNNKLALQFTFSEFQNNGYLVACHDTSTECIYVVTNDVTNSGNVTTYSLLDAKNATAIMRSSYMVYQQTVNGNIVMTVFNMASHEIVNTFDTPAGCVVEGIVGWRDLVYVRINTNNVISTLLYNITTNELFELASMDIGLMKFDTTINSVEYYNARKCHVAVDECMVLNGQMNGGRDYNNQTRTPSVVFTYEDPSAPIEITGATDVLNATLGYAKDGKQLLMTCGMTYTISGKSIFGFNMIDIGNVIDGGTLSIPKSHFPSWSIGSNSYDVCSMRNITLYKDGVITDTGDSQTGYWSPVEHWSHHKIVGTTKTVQSYNNPKRINSPNLSMTISNKI